MLRTAYVLMRVRSHRPPLLHLGLFMAAYALGAGFAKVLAIVPGTGICQPDARRRGYRSRCPVPGLGVVRGVAAIDQRRPHRWPGQ